MGVRAEVEHVVLNLECHAQGFAELAHQSDPIACGADGQCPCRCTHAQQTGRFFVNDVQIGTTGHLLFVYTVGLFHLALTEGRHRAADVIHQVELAALQSDGHIPCQDVVAQNDRLVRLPAGIDRCSAAARVRFVDYVVVDERCDMNHFDQHRRQTGASTRCGTLDRGVEGCRENDQQRADAFAARSKRVVQHFGKEFSVGGELPLDEVFVSLQFRFDGCAYGVECGHNGQ